MVISTFFSWVVRELGWVDEYLSACRWRSNLRKVVLSRIIVSRAIVNSSQMFNNNHGLLCQKLRTLLVDDESLALNLSAFYRQRD